MALVQHLVKHSRCMRSLSHARPIPKAVHASLKAERRLKSGHALPSPLMLH